MKTIILLGRRSGSVSIVTRLRAGRPRLDFRKGQGFLLFITVSHSALGPTQPPIQWVRWIKRSGPETDDSSPSNADVKNGWSYISAPSIRLHGMILVKHRTTLFYSVFWMGKLS